VVWRYKDRHTKARQAWPYGLVVLCLSLLSLGYVDGQPLTNRLPFLWYGLLLQPYYLRDEGHVFHDACLSGCLSH
jgi:hypothetical protein